MDLFNKIAGITAPEQAKNVDFYLQQLQDKYSIDEMRDQLLVKLRVYLVNQKANGKGKLSVTNTEMKNLINKYMY
jgi:hypothetical protein